MDSDRSIMRGTGAGLLEFCDRLAERGDLAKETARGYRISAGRILAVESDDLASIDLRSIDVDDLFDRFAKLNKADFSDGSLTTYRSRFRSALSMYLAWLNDDPGWKTGGRPAQAKGGGTTAARKGARQASKSPVDPAKRGVIVHTPPAVETTTDPSSSSVRLLTYDVPLRPDLIVRITLPVDLTQVDAERLTTFIKSLAFSGRNDSVPEIPLAEGGR
jgi:hypothetical protein